VTAGLLKRMVGFAPGRSIPPLHATTLRAWHAKHANQPVSRGAGFTPDIGRSDVGHKARPTSKTETAPNGGSWPNGRVYLFCDEFTNYHDTGVGIKAVQLLNRLGYEVIIPEHVDSGRAQLSKGLVREAQKLAIRNVELLGPIITAETPLIGLEPSALLGFRDEFPDLVPPALAGAAGRLAKNALLFEEFIAREADRGKIKRESFTTAPRAIKLHGHCHQKALSSLTPAVKALDLPANYKVSLIPSGCCGMAGSFGYEAEHFALSQQIGELVLFPAVRAMPETTLLAASGTSCRHQVKDAIGRHAQHPAEILFDALV